MKILKFIMIIFILNTLSQEISAQNSTTLPKATTTVSTTSPSSTVKKSKRPTKKAAPKAAPTTAPSTTTTASVPVQSGVKMTFVNEHLNIGKVKKGEIKKFDFTFTNTGTEVITIDIASGCDCTTLDYPKTPIKVGGKAIIGVTFDSGKKDESETVDVDIYLKNLNPKTGQRILKVLDYKYELLK